MTAFWNRLDEVRAATDVLEHPFYVRWTKGELRREDLATYAGEYRHAVIAIADAAERAADAAEGPEGAELRSHAAEERSHLELWDRFAAAVDADLDCEPAPQTAECAETWAAGEDMLDHLVALYAIEAAQPAISERKRDSLVRFYGVEAGEATSYFDVHAELDHRHAAEGRELIEARLEGADHDALIERARDALVANWRLLDGVQRLSA